ncbi:MAG: DUF2167 domain-containing protein [Flavobacteriales bacterium]|nr:DUF2167 domain-containing protein [Flavobacteriales bacterium]
MQHVIPFLKLSITILLCIGSWFTVLAQENPYAGMTVAQMDSVTNSRIDSIEATLDYELGTQTLGANQATLQLSSTFKFLGPTEASFALVGILGKPEINQKTWGIVVPFEVNLFNPSAYHFDIHYLDSGYVHQQDLSLIDYKELFLELQIQTGLKRDSLRDKNQKPRTLLQWAQQPIQDTISHSLVWGFKYVVDGETENRIQYEARILGRFGYVSISSEGPASTKAEQYDHLNKVLQSFSFKIGQKYSDYKPCCDQVTSYGTIYLISPNALPSQDWLGNNWKWLLAVGLGLFIIYRRLSNRKNNEEEPSIELD